MQIKAEGVGSENRTRDACSGTGSVQVGCRGPLLGQNGVLHHLGFVVASISKTGEQFAACIAACWDGTVIHDPLQRVRVAFLSPSDPRNPVFELVEPACDLSPVSTFLKKKGPGLHHVCYEIDDLDSGLREAKATGLAIVAAPVPAVAFGGRRIAWVCSRGRLLMELLERDQNQRANGSQDARTKPTYA